VWKGSRLQASEMEASEKRPLHAVMTRRRNDAFAASLSRLGYDDPAVSAILHELCRVYGFDPEASTRARTIRRNEQLRRRADELGVSLHKARAPLSDLKAKSRPDVTAS